jgi:hypothetical protein
VAAELDAARGELVDEVLVVDAGDARGDDGAGREAARGGVGALARRRLDGLMSASTSVAETSARSTWPARRRAMNSLYGTSFGLAPRPPKSWSAQKRAMANSR